MPNFYLIIMFDAMNLLEIHTSRTSLVATSTKLELKNNNPSQIELHKGHEKKLSKV